MIEYFKGIFSFFFAGKLIYFIYLHNNTFLCKKKMIRIGFDIQEVLVQKRD